MKIKEKMRGMICSLAVATVTGCSASEPAMEAATSATHQELRNCQVVDCPLPGDPPPPPPPPPPPQPDPKKFRTVVIPTVWVTDKVNAVLAATVIQISHTDGEELPLPGFRRECVANSSPEYLECLSECNALPPVQIGACRTWCTNNLGTCTSQCHPVASSTKSFVRWGPAAKLLSADTPCNATTCPACATPTNVKSLRDDELAVPVYRRDMSVPFGPAWYIQCRYNRWRFEFGYMFGKQTPVQVTSSPSGISFRMSGSSGSPSVVCENAPDVYIDDLAFDLTFSFPWFGSPFIVADGDFEGQLSSSASPVVDFLFDLESQVHDKVREIAHARLNRPEYVALYLSIFRKLIDTYLSEERLPPIAILGQVQTGYDGLHVSYWMQ